MKLDFWCYLSYSYDVLLRSGGKGFAIMLQGVDKREWDDVNYMSEYVLIFYLEKVEWEIEDFTVHFLLWAGFKH
jgi:hypothetical protein